MLVLVLIIGHILYNNIITTIVPKMASVHVFLWGRDRSPWLELDEDDEVGDCSGCHPLQCRPADWEELQRREVFHSCHLEGLLPEWKWKQPFWRRDKDFPQGGLEAIPAHVYGTLREIYDKLGGSCVNLLWRFSTQETLLKRWQGPLSARMSRLMLTIPIKVSLP